MLSRCLLNSKLRVGGFAPRQFNRYAFRLKIMKFVAQTIFFLIICVSSIPAQGNLPRFEDYEVSLHRGKTHLPKWIRRVSEGEWRDDLGKLVESPQVNFAGKYFVAAHSCGTGCRYYTMTDLSCTWSACTFISIISIPSFCRSRFPISLLAYSLISSFNIRRRYFGQNIKWYLHS